MARIKRTARNSTGGNAPINEPRKSVRQLHHLCIRFMHYRNLGNSVAMVGKVNKLLGWFNRHKNDIVFFKAATMYTDFDGRTGLHYIVQVDDSFQVIDTWLKYAPETAQVKDKYDKLPLHDACFHGFSLEKVMALLEAYSKGVEELDVNRNLPLHCACSNGPSLEVVIAVLKAYPKGVEETNVHGKLPLHFACYHGSFEVVKVLIQAYPKGVEERNDEGELPLHIACRNGSSLEVVMALVEAYPKGTEEKSNDGDLPLHLACYHGSSLEVVMAVVEAYPKGVKETNLDANLPLHCACYPETDFSIEVISLLLKSYPESIDGEENETKASHLLRGWANTTQGNVSDVLNEAIIGGHLFAVKLFLIAFPQSVLMRDIHGMVPLHYACSNIASMDIVMVLLDAAPESTIILDKLGRTPLQVFMPFSKLKNENGMLPLHFQAAHSKSLTVNFLKFLVAAYPDSIDVPDNRGMLPYQYAFINNKFLSVDVLMYFVLINIQRV
jgi:ankyrin repeat protein